MAYLLLGYLPSDAAHPTQIRQFPALYPLSTINQRYLVRPPPHQAGFAPTAPAPKGRQKSSGVKSFVQITRG